MGALQLQASACGRGHLRPLNPPKTPGQARGGKGGVERESPYFSLDLRVLRRGAGAQAAQKQQAQSQQPGPPRRCRLLLLLLPATEEADRPVPPSRRARVAAHAPRVRTRGARPPTRGRANLPRSLGTPTPALDPSPPTLGDFPRPGRLRGRARAGPSAPISPPGGPAASQEAQLPSLCLAQRSGRPDPRRPPRVRLLVSMLRG